MPYTILAGDPRAVGTGNPPSDANNLNDVVTGMGGVFNPVNTAYAGGADKTGVADSTAAFQACMTAAVAAAGEMIIPPGTYKLNAGPLNFTGPLRIRALGASMNQGPGVPNAVTLNCNGGGAGTAHMFAFPWQGYLWGGLEIQGININYTGTGNVFDTVNINGAVFRDNQITVTSGAAMILYTTGNNSAINITHERCNFNTTAAVRSNPMVSMSSVIPQGVSENTFFRCGFTNAGLDNTQFMIYFACTAPNTGYHIADNLIDCYFEHPFGGIYKSMSGSNIKIDGCTYWDIYPSLGVSAGNSMFYFGQYPGNMPHQSISILGLSRSLNCTNLDGVHNWDIYCEATTSQVYIRGFSVNPASASTQTNLYANFNGCNDVVLVNNESAQGATVNGNSVLAVTNSSPTQISLSQGIITGSVAGNSWVPGDMGFASWAFDPAGCPFTARLPAFGVLTLIGLWIRTGAVTLTNISVNLATLGSGLTSGQNLLGLYSKTGTLLGFSADQTATWNTGGSVGYKTAAMTAQSGGSLTLVPTGLYWVGILANGSTTAPAFGSGNNISGTQANGPISVTTARYATNGSALTALPTSITPSGNALAIATMWAAIY